jgi:hypothetical protein
MAAKETLFEIMQRKHLEEHPTCTYGDEPHFVPPSFGQIGFYLCDPPEDITNKTRIVERPSFDVSDFELTLAAGAIHSAVCGCNAVGGKNCPDIDFNSLLSAAAASALLFGLKVSK